MNERSVCNHWLLEHAQMSIKYKNVGRFGPAWDVEPRVSIDKVRRGSLQRLK